MDESVLVFEGVADGGLCPGARRPLPLVTESGAIVLAEIGERTVDELASRIDVGLRVGLQVVVFEATEGVLPGSGAADGKLSAGQEIVLVGHLVRVRGQHRSAVEPPVRLDAGPVVGVPKPKSKGHTRREANANIAAQQSVRIDVVDALSLGVELVSEKIKVVDFVGARD